MPLSPGTRIGIYEVVGELGAGGMGEVYRARDLKLGRDVALKVLPDSLAADADRLARFRREAQLLAALNHPNIAHVHGFEDSGPVHALAMELVEGPTLADRLALGPIAPDEAIAIAHQIADALESAHEQGIIHRDLKPANVKVRDDGTVKVLDFGLAKALDPTDPASKDSVSNSPTLTARATQMGMILGTAAYMAPEQARGRPVDRRADIWAFGVVLYEMLTGRRAFDGDDVSITLASVLKEDVSWSALPAELPPAIRRLLRRCLEKDPKRRLSSIADARLELDEVPDPPATPSTPSIVAPPRRGWTERIVWAGVVVLAAVGGLLLGPRAVPAVVSPHARFGITPPEGGRFAGVVPRFAVSPNGESVVFSATSESGKREQLWLRRLDSLEARPIPGTEAVTGAEAPQSPFWSPDGRHLGFFVQSSGLSETGQIHLRIVDLQGGSVQRICDLPSNNGGGSWNADGVILVSSQQSKGIQRVPAGGGVPAPVTTVDEARGEIAHLFPQFLPDGRRFLYQVFHTDRGKWATWVASLDGSAPREWLKADYARFAAPDRLLYVRDDKLLMQPVDPAALKLVGEPALVDTGVESMSSNGRAAFAVSNAGVLVYSSNQELAAGGAQDRQLTWFDRAGRPAGVVGPPTSAARLRLAPDGNRVALIELQPRSTSPLSGSLWAADLRRGVTTPLTSATELALSPLWADNARLIFGVRDEKGTTRLAERPASGVTPAATIVEMGDRNLIPLDVSSSGDLVVFAVGRAGVRELHVWSRADGKTRPYLGGKVDYPQAALSPDGRWIAYVSNESSDYEVTVQTFPDPARGKWPVSQGGGLSPRWRRDGKELFYVDREQRLMSVAVTPGGDFSPGPPKVLFTLPFGQLRLPVGGAHVYDAAPDGERFILPIPRAGAAERRPLTVLTNWRAGR